MNIELFAYSPPEYLPTEWVGAIVKIHHPDEDPVPEEGGIAVSPGTLNRLSLERVSHVIK